MEQLEDRFQPSVTALDLLPQAPVSSAAMVRGTTDLVTPSPSSDFSRLFADAIRTARVDVAAAAVRRELILIDRDVPDREALLRDLLAARPAGASVEVVELNGGGVAEVGAVLRSRHGLDAVHLVSHGEAGALHLGGDRLALGTLDRFADDLRGWGAALNPGADFLFYGCDLAGSTAGRALTDQIAALTGADVAASTDLTGDASLGGDWDLEYRTGGIEASPLRAGDWA